MNYIKTLAGTIRVARSMAQFEQQAVDSLTEALTRTAAFYDRCEERGIQWPPAPAQ